ncbi:Dienelactone hydrolase [Geodermatophilus obscurus]|uniref:Dienelactone hydrolase n=1 Tax=Geodermatophilus obscurus TaxID=1861 RepID=A0A1I5F956_9ACTN|nr:dienelactone hydrolase family protein [Geodermatophilus obscurus]SFO20274.1 Dienelactone hydrolase [Geodermatophilus obscurus]
MASIALFHSVLGVRPGISDAAGRLRAAGHDVLVVDQYDGRVFDDYGEAGRYVEEVGFPALMARAADAVRDLPDGFVAAGFSNGAGMAEHVATRRRVSGVLLASGALPMAVLGAPSWPAGVAAQLHRATGDPHASAEWDEALAADVAAAGGVLEVVRYEVAGHLFTDPSLPAEYDAAATERFWREALSFVGRVVG